LHDNVLGSAGLGNAARARMRAGDCVGALDLFDQALFSSTDPALRRDRGVCHEKLGQPYPAIDDYRAYLTNAPDAPDAAGIREHLERLEDETSGSDRSTSTANDDIPPAARIGTEVDEPAANGKTKTTTTNEPTAVTPSSDGTTADEDALEEMRSPLRAGRGFSLAPFVDAHKWIRDGVAFGDGETWAQGVGVEIRYSTSSRGAVVLDLGYEHFDSTVLNTEVVAGFASLFGYEFRFPLNARYDDQLTLMPAVGYDQLSFTPGNSNANNYSEAALSGRLRFGYRHMLAGSVALDVALEGGAAYFFKFDSAVDGHDAVAGLAGLRVALLWGL
jgi:hypothetical protein